MKERLVLVRSTNGGAMLESCMGFVAQKKKCWTRIV